MNAGKWFKRIGLLVLTNLLVMVTISIAFNIIVSALGLHQAFGNLSYLLVFSLVWGMGGAFISLLISKWMAKAAMGVEIIDPNSSNPRMLQLVHSVHRLSEKAGLTTMPEVGIYDSPEINAFATGPSKSNSLVAVSTGLLNAMSADEVEGVLGHEVAHIANGDMVTMTLIQGVVNAFVLFFARIIANVVASQFDEKARGVIYFVTTIVLDIVFALLGSIVVSYFSRVREFRADAGGAAFAGKAKMIAGLQRLKAQFENLEPDNSNLATMKISSRGSGLMALFSTHPPLDVRIERLQKLSTVR